jgi:hypothetical protein
MNGAMIDPAVAPTFNFGDCSKSGALLGGVQIGENFQSGRAHASFSANLFRVGIRTGSGIGRVAEISAASRVRRVHKIVTLQ